MVLDFLNTQPAIARRAHPNCCKPSQGKRGTGEEGRDHRCMGILKSTVQHVARSCMKIQLQHSRQMAPSGSSPLSGLSIPRCLWSTLWISVSVPSLNRSLDSWFYALRSTPCRIDTVLSLAHSLDSWIHAVLDHSLKSKTFSHFPLS